MTRLRRWLCRLLRHPSAPLLEQDRAEPGWLIWRCANPACQAIWGRTPPQVNATLITSLSGQAHMKLKKHRSEARRVLAWRRPGNGRA